MIFRKVMTAVLIPFVSIGIHLISLTAASSETVEVQENIFAIVNGDGMDSNTTFIVTNEGVIVIDTRVTPGEAKKVMLEIRKQTDLPVVYTINTHYHGDHTFGNQVFRDSKTIIAHKNVWRALKGSSGKEHLDFFKSFKIPGLDEVTVTPPNVIFEKKMEIFLGGYRLKLIHLGKGHTDGDVFILIDGLKTVVSGDLIFNRQIPYMGDGNVEGWIKSLDHLDNLDAEIVIPGHGNVGGKPIIIAMKHYLLDLKTFVLKEVNEGKTLSETKEIVTPRLKKKYGSWGHQERMKGNIERAYMEFSIKEKI